MGYKRPQSDEGGTKKRMSGLLMSEYEGMIGIREANPNAVCHDVLSMYMVYDAS